MYTGSANLWVGKKKSYSDKIWCSCYSVTLLPIIVISPVKHLVFQSIFPKCLTVTQLFRKSKWKWSMICNRFVMVKTYHVHGIKPLFAYENITAVILPNLFQHFTAAGFPPEPSGILTIIMCFCIFWIFIQQVVLFALSMHALFRRKHFFHLCMCVCVLCKWVSCGL